MRKQLKGPNDALRTHQVGGYKASADPACLELLVCECGLLCGKGFGDGGAEHPGLDEVTKFFKNVVTGCVAGNDDGVPGDADHRPRCTSGGWRWIRRRGQREG